MRRQFSILGIVSTLGLLAASGCRPQQPFYFHERGDLGHYVGMATDIEYPDVETTSLDEVEKAKPPLTLDNPMPESTFELSLEEAVRYGLANGTVVRAYRPTAGGAVSDQLLANPQAAVTIFNPALVESDARQGVEAALAAFDAQFAASVFWEKNDTPMNIDTSGFRGIFFRDVTRQDLATFQTQISKFAATGDQFTIRNNVRYDANNNPTRRWRSDYNVNVEAEFRHPFMQGAGVGFNRIAGPGGVPGFNNGVLIARLRVDQSLASLEANVRNLVSDMERAYWELYYSYRSLETAIAGRDSSLKTWRIVWAKYQTSAKGGGALDEAQARHQYYLFAAAVERAQSTLYQNENSLRYMIGLAASDGRLIYPTTEPTTAKVQFDWHDAHGEALVRSPELREQKWVIKQREVDLMAAKNWLLPRLDAVGRYRWLGLGDDLIDPSRAVDADGRVLDAFSSMTGGDFQEWHLGLEARFPFGFRREKAGVRNAQLALTRDRKVYQEQELELSHLLDAAFRDLSRQYHLSQTNFNRYAASVTEVRTAQAAWEAGAAEVSERRSLETLLDAQRRKAEAEVEYHRALVDYNVAITQIHFRKGSLLEYNGVFLAEGPWPAKAYFDARRRARGRDAAKYINYGFTQPKVVSRGPYQQQFGDEGPVLEGSELLPGEAMELTPTPAPTPQEVDRPRQKESLPSPKPLPADQPPKPKEASEPTDQGSPPAGQSKAAGALRILVPSAKANHNEGSDRKVYDLGSMNLSGLADQPGIAPGASGGEPSGVQPAGYYEISAPAGSENPSASSSAWTSPDRPSTGHEPVADPPSPATDPSAPGWKGVPHRGTRPGL